MAIIKPFQCIHPARGLVERIAALPYDVYNRAEARREAAGEPLSFLNIDRAETQFEEGHDMYAPEVYQRAHDLLWGMVREGKLIQERQPGYYLYELTREGRSQTVIVACASIDDYQNGVIRKHENTRADKEADRTRHVDVCHAQTGPVFLAHRRDEGLGNLVDQVKRRPPFFSFTSRDGVIHRGWSIFDAAEIGKIRSAYEKIGPIYIADGHHRAASAVKVGQMRRKAHPDYSGTEEFNYFLSVLFPAEELLIMDYNRLVRDLNGLTKTQFLEKVSEKCEIEPSAEAVRPGGKGQMGLYLENQWYLLTAKPELLREDPVEGLDVSFLQREILEPVLRIKDPKTDPRIDFVGGVRGLEELERRVKEDCAAAFSMYPTSIGELFAVADAGRLMPPKSTWFEPKLRSGIFIHGIEAE